MKRAALPLLALALGGSALAQVPEIYGSPIYGRVSQDVTTWSQQEILDGFGKSKPGMFSGSAVSKSLSKAGRFVKWGGAYVVAPILINEAFNWFYNEAQRSANPALDAWWKGAGPSNARWPYPAEYSSGSYTFKHVNPSYKCTTSDRDYYSATLQTYNGSTLESSEFVYLNVAGTVPTWGGYTDAAAINNACGTVKTLQELSTSNPGSVADIPNIVQQYLDAHPRKAIQIVSPTPNVNQEEDDVIDPGLDTDGDGFTDGDELRRGPGVLTNPGNRPHTDDGAESDPSDPSSKPRDTDGDGIPDWRDSDDDNDGVQDEDEEPDTPTSSPQKDPKKKPESFTDTDGDGLTDDVDPDDDNDGSSDIEEEQEGTDKKDPNSKPLDTDKDGTPDSRDPDDDNDGFTDEEEDAEGTDKKDPNSKPEREPIKCQPGQVPSEDNKSCVPEKDPPKCPEGQKPDESTPPKCVPDTDPKDPVDDECGDMSIPRMMAHTKNWVRDWVVPCKSLGDVFKPLMDKAGGRYPFAMVTAFNSGVVKVPGSGDRAAALPDKLGPFTLDWAWLTPLITIVGLLFKGATSWIAVDLVLSRLMGQVVVK